MVTDKEKELFFEYLESKDYSKTTIITTKNYFLKLEELGLENLDNCYNEITKLRSTTRNNYIIVLNRWCKYKGIEKKYKLRKRRVEDQREREEYITEEDIKEMIKASKTGRTKAEISVLFGTGIRVRELVSLKHAHLDPINKRFVGFQGKGNKKGNAYFIGELGYLYNYFTDYLKWKKTDKTYSRYTTPEDYIFCNDKGDNLSPQTVWHDIKNATNVLEKKKSISPHILRHSFTYLAMQLGIPIDAISKNLGHASIQVTEQVYAHYNDDLQQKRFIGNNNNTTEKETTTETKKLKKCPNCGFNEIEEDFLVCPMCDFRFKYRCKCLEKVDINYKRCPYCELPKELAMVETIKFYEDQADEIKFNEIIKVIRQVTDNEITIEESQKRIEEIRKRDKEIIKLYEETKKGDKDGI